jgi:hypothetical protein
MAKVSFVGFQEKVEIPEGFQLLEVEEIYSSTKSKDNLYALLSDPDQISQWLATVRTFDSRPGGKLIFDDGSVATCTSFVLGKEVSFIADSFGNFTAKVAKGNEGNSIQIKFAILTDDVEGKSAEILEILSRLQALL